MKGNNDMKERIIRGREMEKKRKCCIEKKKEEVEK